MKNKINIKVFADIICPWCFIGCNHLNVSLKSRKFYKYEIDWQPFYLNPTMPTNGIDRKKYLKNKFGNQVNLIESQILSAANNHNIIINLKKIKTTPNTRKIHSAISLIKKHNLNKSYDLAFKIMSDYFVNGTDIRSEDYLIQSISKFDKQADLNSFKEINHGEYIEPFLNFDFVNGVPVFIFNDKWTLNGAQSPKVLETIIDIASKD